MSRTQTHRHIVAVVSAMQYMATAHCGVSKRVSPSKVLTPGDYLGRALSVCQRCERIAAKKAAHAQPMGVEVTSCAAAAAEAGGRACAAPAS